MNSPSRLPVVDVLEICRTCILWASNLSTSVKCPGGGDGQLVCLPTSEMPCVYTNNILYEMQRYTMCRCCQGPQTSETSTRTAKHGSESWKSLSPWLPMSDSQTAAFSSNIHLFASFPNTSSRDQADVWEVRNKFEVTWKITKISTKVNSSGYCFRHRAVFYRHARYQ